jgi:hypothetical protein
MVPLDSGYRDPWRYDDPQPTERIVDGYLSAAAHLLDAGLTPCPFLPELRVLWRRGGSDRALVSEIATRWEVAT